VALETGVSGYLESRVGIGKMQVAGAAVRLPHMCGICINIGNSQKKALFVRRGGGAHRLNTYAARTRFF
jgi:hypothetical protein